MVDDAQRVLPVTEAGAEALAQRLIKRLLASVPEGWVAKVVAEPDRLGQVLVQAQGAGDGTGNPAGLQRVRESGPVVIPLGGDEDLRLVLEAPEGLGMDDAVAVTLKRRPHWAVRLLPLTLSRIGPGRPRGQKLLLPSGDAVVKGGGGGHSPSLSGGTQLDVRVVLQSLANCALDLAQSARLGLGSFVERLRQAADHEPMGFLVERKGPRFAAGADDTAGGAGESDQVIGLAAERAGGELRSETGDERQLDPERERGLVARCARRGGIVEQSQVATEEVVGGRVRLRRVEQAQHRVTAPRPGGEGGRG